MRFTESDFYQLEEHWFKVHAKLLRILNVHCYFQSNLEIRRYYISKIPQIYPYNILHHKVSCFHSYFLNIIFCWLESILFLYVCKLFCFYFILNLVYHVNIRKLEGAYMSHMVWKDKCYILKVWLLLAYISLITVCLL